MWKWQLASDLAMRHVALYICTSVLLFDHDSSAAIGASVVLLWRSKQVLRHRFGVHFFLVRQNAIVMEFSLWKILYPDSVVVLI
jgi:hypothetical protein